MISEISQDTESLKERLVLLEILSRNILVILSLFILIIRGIFSEIWGLSSPMPLWAH